MKILNSITYTTIDGIAPCIALENANVRSALAARDAVAVEFALANEF